MTNTFIPKPRTEEDRAATGAVSSPVLQKETSSKNIKTFVPQPRVSAEVNNQVEPEENLSPEVAEDKTTSELELKADVLAQVNAMFDTELAATKKEEYSEDGKSTRTGERRQEEFADMRRIIEQDLRKQGVMPEVMEQAVQDEMQARGMDIGALTETAEVYAEQESARAIEKVSEKKARLVELLTSRNFMTSGLTDKLLNSGLSISQINTIATADEFLNPVTGIVDSPILFADAQENIAKGEYFKAAGNLTLSGVSALPALGVVKFGPKYIGKALGIKRASIENYTTAQKAMDAEGEAAEAVKKKASNLASKNAEQRNELIEAFETRNRVTISTDNRLGNKVLDTTMVREAGKTLSKQTYDEGFLSTVRDTSYMFDKDRAITAEGGFPEEQLLHPILQPDKLDGLTAVVSELKKKYPNSFTRKYIDKIQPDGSKKRTLDPNQPTVIDQLFDYAVTGELKETEELMDMLSEYGLSFEDYILTVVGSGSRAGEILAKLSHISRQKSALTVAEDANKASMQSRKTAKKLWRNLVLRPLDLRRGAMVGTMATAARNVTSFGIRAPAEVLGNIMEDAAYNFATEVQGKGLKGLPKGVYKGVETFLKPSTYTDSFKEMKYIFAQPLRAKDMTEYILKRPELKDMEERLLGGINEIQKIQGRGQATTKVGKAADAVMSGLEDTVRVLNTPNLLQEHILRRGTFYGELERLVKKEYGKDLNTVLDNGQIRDLLNDTTTVRPSGAQSFHSLMEQATYKALDVTYGKAPDFWAFRDLSNIITKSGLTTVIPFPRFMFSSLELMGRYSLGAARPITKLLTGTVKTRADVRGIGENMIGVAAMIAMYKYRMSDEAPERYTEMRATETGDTIDISPQFPMRQYAYIAEAYKQIQQGNFENFDPSGMELIETFLGSTFRVGGTSVILNDMREMAAGIEGRVEDQRVRRFFGKFIGQLGASYLTPLYQITDAQRLQGVRGMKYKDFKEEPALTGGFTEEFTRGFKQRGMVAPSVEEALPEREFLYNTESDRIGLGKRLLFGLNFKKEDSAEGKYLSTLGLEDYQVGSKHPSPTVRNFENSILRDFLPVVVRQAKRAQKRELASYDKRSNVYKEKYDKAEAGIDAAQSVVKSTMKEFQSKIKSGIVGRATPFTQSLMKYRDLGKDRRLEADKKFLKRYKREPDYTTLKDITRLIVLGGG